MLLPQQTSVEAGFAKKLILKGTAASSLLGHGEGTETQALSYILLMSYMFLPLNCGERIAVSINTSSGQTV